MQPMDAIVNIVVDNRVRVQVCRGAAPLLDHTVVTALQRAFTHRNPQYGKLRSMRWSTQDEQPYDRTWGTDGEWLTFPRGGMSRVREVLRANGLRWSVQDHRTSGEDPGFAGVPRHLVELWPHQNEAVDAAVVRQNCLIRAPTGSGKTTAGFGLAARVNLPTLVILWDRNLLKQWLERCTRELGIAPHDVGLVQGPPGKWRVGTAVTLAMQQTLSYHAAEVERRLSRRFGLVLCDEVQRFAAPTLFGAVDPFCARYRVGISADETRKDRKEYLIYDLFGEVAAEIKQADLIASGHVVDVAIRVWPTEFKAPWYVGKMRSGRLREQDFNRLLVQMVKDQERNLMVADVAAQQAREGHRLLVWSHRREHCIALDHALATRGVRAGLMLGGDNDAAAFEATKQGLRAGTCHAGVGTLKALAQAIDIPELDSGVLATPLASNRQQFGQVRGRLCRKGKSSAALHYLWDRWVYGAGHLANLVKWYGPAVQVRHEGQWVDGKEFVRWVKEQDAADERLDGIFATSPTPSR